MSGVKLLAMKCQRTDFALGGSGGADFSAEQNDSVAKIGAFFWRQDFAQLLLNFLRIFTAIGQTQTTTNADAMGIADYAARFFIKIAKQKICRFAAYAGDL